MPTALTDVSILPDASLFRAEDGLHQMFAVRKDARADTSDVEAAFDALTMEMASRSLVWRPLELESPARTRKSKSTPDAKHFGEDGDGDDDETNDERDDPDNDGGTTTVPSGDTNGAPDKPTQGTGPVVKKTATAAVVKKDHAKGVTSDDDGIHTKTGTKSGKGGEKGRTQDDIYDESDLPKGGGKKSDGPIVMKRHDFKKRIAKGKLAPHLFTPIAPVDKAATPTDGLSHDFAPVRNVCRICRQKQEDHVSKNVGTDGSMFKAISDDTIDDRKSGADAGLALPDGSFFIPDEAHLHQAIRLVGQAPDPQTAMNHIIERAQAMGLESALPPAWRAMTASGMPDTPQVGPGANTMAAGQGAATSPGTPGSKTATAPGAGPTQAQAPKPKNIIKRLRKMMGAGATDDQMTTEFLKSIIELDPMIEYAVISKSSGKEDRYTLGPVYMPNTLDAHGEWATAEDLQKSAWDYVAKTGADRRVYLQHSPQPAGEWVEIVTWPQEVTARMMKSVDGVRKAVDSTFPAGTVYMGVRWYDWAWDDVKKGKITGFSMGGSARRVEGLPE